MKHFLSIAGILLTILSFVLGNSHDESKPEPVSDLVRAPQATVFDKLLGTWYSEDKDLFERWTKKGTERYQSTVYKLSKKDTVVDEQASIYRLGNRWIFEVLANGQNAGKAVKFSATVLTANRAVFFNPAHDFPNLICYSLPQPLELRAYIAGRNTTGGMDTILFNYKRYPN